MNRAGDGASNGQTDENRSKLHQQKQRSHCDREKQELDRLRANPDRRDAERFARGMTCAALKPQAARLLDSLND